MATKKEGHAGPKYTPRKHLELPTKANNVDAIGRAYAKHFTGGAFAALRVIAAADKSAGYERDMDMPALLATLRDQGEAASTGDLAQAEAMLMNQATALQSVFARLIERGMGCTEIAPFEANLRMGLRAQSQCRATLETLAAIKNPASVAFVRQANIAHGPQQVNNGTPAPSRPRENEITPSKLSGGSDGLLQDAGAPAATGQIDPQVETVGEIDRTEVRRG